MTIDVGPVIPPSSAPDSGVAMPTDTNLTRRIETPERQGAMPIDQLAIRPERAQVDS